MSGSYSSAKSKEVQSSVTQNDSSSNRLDAGGSANVVSVNSAGAANVQFTTNGIDGATAQQILNTLGGAAEHTVEQVSAIAQGATSAQTSTDRLVKEILPAALAMVGLVIVAVVFIAQLRYRSRRRPRKD